MSPCRPIPTRPPEPAVTVGQEAGSGLGVLLAPGYSVKGELDRRALVPLFPGFRPLEDRFALYQKPAKARLVTHRLLTAYLKELTPSEFGA